MIITEIRIQKVINTNNKLVGIASITLDEMIVIHDMKIIKAKEKMFLSMPSKKVSEKFYDIVHPINNVARKGIENLLLKAYEETSKENNGETYYYQLTATNANSFVDQTFDEFELQRIINKNIRSSKNQDSIEKISMI